MTEPLARELPAGNASELAEDEVYVFPTSFAQQRLWFLDQFEPGSPFYNIPCAARLTGWLDVAALERALNEIIRRHETLRTTFTIQDGQPVQVIAPRLILPLPVVDLRDLAESERAAEAMRQVNGEARKPFDLSRAPLLRARLLRLRDDEHIVLLTMHHIVSDVWSMGVLVREIGILYAAFSTGQPSPLPELSIQYADFAQWQRDHLQGKVLDEQIQYWKKQLSGNLPVLELPTDRPRPAIQTSRGSTQAMRISARLTESLKALSQKEGATLFMTLMAAFQTMLRRYTNQEDICVGTPIAGRTLGELEQLIGVFINTLVIRTDLSGDPTFRELLQRVRRVTLDAYAHQDLPFEQLVEVLQPERDMSHSPLFQAMLILQNAPAKTHALPALTLEMIDSDSGTSTYDLTFSISEMATGLDVSVEYNTDLFNANTIARMLEHYRILLEGITANPDQHVSTLPLLSDAERHRLLVEWNSTRRDYPSDQCVHQLFETQVEQTPDAVAVVWQNERLTYRELNCRANQTAHRLQQMGVAPETLVGICVERSLEMLVGILGILKAGGAYVPIDPTYPRERIAHMLSDARVPVLLTQQRLVAGLPDHAARVLLLDADRDSIAQESDANPTSDVKPGNLAYVIYTSGSTGQSKGVMIEHGALVNQYHAWEEEYRLRRDARVHLQMASFSFDVFSGDLVRALCSGSALVLCPREFLLAPSQLYELMRREHVDCAEFVPAVLRNLVQYLEETNQRLDFMRLLICGSDVWYVGEYHKFKRMGGPQTRLINSFGLTEATIDSSYFEGALNDAPADRLAPIGRPFPNTRLYILDRHLQPQPIGVPGELCVGGAGLARGYLNRPELTAEKFISVKDEGGRMKEETLPQAFIPHPSSFRLYRTGDLARYLPDGNVELLGRTDFQVKIRGYRVEVGEVEAVLRQHPAVRDAAVAARDARLAAYLVADIPVDRVPVRGKCVVEDDGNGASPAEFSTVDLSYRGLCLTDVPAAWQVGQHLSLRLHLPGIPDELAMNGAVTWRENGHAGIVFDPTPEQEKLLHHSVAHVMETPGGLVADLRDREPRVPLRAPCLVEFDGGNQKELFIENLSRGGVRLIGETELWAKGHGVRLRLQLPGESTELWLKGSVWWHRGERAGIKFETTPAEGNRLDHNITALIHARGFSLAELRVFLKSKLPDYMVPSAFVMLNALPLTPNGKLDRNALPAPDWSRRDLENTFAAPRTPVEEMLAGIWKRVLGVEQVGVHDNFFEMGGHSLLATQLVSRVREAFQIELPLRHIFESPTIAELAEYVEIAQRAAEGVHAPPIQPASRERELPLSFAQQRLWFLDQLEPNSPFYNLSDAVRLTGPFDANAFEHALNEIVRRHEALRTTFASVDGRAIQAIAPSLQISLTITDLRAAPASTREAAALRLATEEAQRPFDLARGPLLRARLLRLRDDEHIVLLTMHHIVGDNWSSNVLTQEIAVLYDAFVNGRSSPLPELPIQYADFAAWQREWLQGDVLETQLAYWKQQLSGSPPLLELPTDRPHPAIQTFNGAYQTFSLSESLSRAIKALCQTEGATLFMTLLAAFQVLLHRYTGQEDINVGTPIANRNRAEIEGLIGFFVNTLVMRGNLTGEPSFRELVRRARATALGAYAHQDLPFEMTVDALQPNRDMSHSPLFQVMLVLQSSQMHVQQISSNLTLSPIEAHSGTAKFDLTLFMVEEAERLSGAFEYNTDLFDAATITRMIGHFQTLLEGIAVNPDQSISTLPILTEAERRQLLVEWNDTEAEYPRDLCAHQLIEAQVERTPDAIALKFENETLTYRELDRRANQLARYLQKRGVAPETLVGICVERSIEMVIGLLGILKAGGAYVPLDPTYPQGRLAFMLEDSNVQVLLTQARLVERLPQHTAQTLCLDSDWQAIAQEGDENPISAVTPENLAYMIYTSGSTGKPKGALILHRGLVNYLTWCQRAYPLDAGHGAPVHSSISFDLTVTALFAPLTAGRTVTLLPESQGVEALGETLRQHRDFSLVKITPAHLELMSQQLLPAEAAGCTRAFIIGGENLTAEHIAFWQKYAPETQLVNEYGPTETVVGCCVYTTPVGKRTTGVIPIGRPIINTRLYVLDKHWQPVPIGVMGELYIGGVGVARGYLNRPELTAEKFISVDSGQWTVDRPTSTDHRSPTTRLYKTGDLVRWLPDGNLEYLCRVDFQVKVRGFRVELGEIETVLCQHPAVREAVAWIWEPTGSKRLVAYVVPQNKGDRLDANALRDFLKDRLPEYMVPSAFAVLDALPLTSNGKVDHAALPAPDGARLDLPAEYVAPRTPQEKILADIWAQLLGIKQISVHDNFFELGGDSILGIQVIARAHQAGLHLTPKQLFQAPTIEGLAAAASATAVVRAEQGIVQGDVPLTPIQRWFFEQEQPEPHHWNQTILFAVRERLNRAWLEDAVKHLLEHHDALRMRFTRDEVGWRASNAALDDAVPFEWNDLAGLSEGEQTGAIEARAAELEASLNLAAGPLVRVAYFDLGAEKPARFLMILHHLIVDGMSWRILLEDLQTAYEQSSRGAMARLPLKTTSFCEWAQHLSDYAQSDAARQELDYWLQPMTIAPIPVDEAGGDNSEASARSVAVSLDAEETQALLFNVPSAYQTGINDVLLTALALAFERWTGLNALRVDLEGHGREDLFDDVDVSRTVGWFTAMYPVVLRVDAQAKPSEALQVVKEQLQRVPRRGIGYGLLRYLRNDEKIVASLRALPHAEVSFNYLGQIDQALSASTPFEPASESHGADRSPRGERTHWLDINGGIIGGCLQMEWTYSENAHRRETIERVAQTFIEELRSLITCSQFAEPKQLESADLAEFGWSEKDVQDILSEIGKSGS